MGGIDVSDLADLTIGVKGFIVFPTVLGFPVSDPLIVTDEGELRAWITRKPDYDEVSAIIIKVNDGEIADVSADFGLPANELDPEFAEAFLADE
ncbi:hypothetical protein ACQPZJ_35600 [Actinoplanes sp. CA-054009]